MSNYPIKKVLKEYGIVISESQENQLEKYMLGVLEYNKSINLTAVKDPDEFIYKHYVDSLTILMDEKVRDYISETTDIIDVGTGGGFPGVPLAILMPDKNFTLLDSLNKRLKIIDELCAAAGINNVRTLHSRAEDAGRDLKEREKYDLCVSRAVSNLAVLSEYTLPLVKTGGHFIAYKGNDIKEELEEGRKAVEVLGGKVESVVETCTEEKLVIIKKERKTPPKYPRKAGDPKKNPIGKNK